MKLYAVSAIVLLNAVASFSVYVPPGESKGETPLYSPHIPYHLAPLDLTTGEIKLFAGHSMQFLKAKCPAVSKDALPQISKYIAKLVSKTNPVPERSIKFDKLLTSISSCAMQDTKAVPETPDQASDEVAADQSTSYFHSFLTPFIKIQGFFAPAEPETGDTESTRMEIDSVTSPPNDKVQESTTPLIEDGAGTFIKITGKSMGKGDDSESEEAQDSATKGSVEQAPDDGMTFFRVSHVDSADDNPWTNWVKKMFHAVRDYFENIFGAGNVMFSGQTVSYRAKRDVEIVVATPEEDVAEKVEKTEPKKVENMSEKSNGKLAFLQLMDNVCRVYCAQCHDGSQILNFKAAAKALLNFVYEDTTGVELAAKHFLEPSVFEALEKCS